MILELAGRRAAPLICFDIEFPEPGRQLALAGAELLVTASANMDPFFIDHAVGAVAGAREQAPHLYANLVGSGDGLVFVGASRSVPHRRDPRRGEPRPGGAAGRAGRRARRRRPATTPSSSDRLYPSRSRRRNAPPGESHPRRRETPWLSKSRPARALEARGLFVRQSSGLIREFRPADVFVFNTLGYALGLVLMVVPTFISGLWPEQNVLLVVLIGTVLTVFNALMYGYLAG